MIDVDARGRHEAELLREEAAAMADTETALQSVLDGDLLVPLVTQGERTPRPVVAGDPVSARRRVPVLVGVAIAGAVVAAVAFLPSNQPKVVPTGDTAVTSSTDLVVQPLDPPIECELELCPSLAVSPEGTLVAYDQAAKTLTWYDAKPNVVSVTADLDAEHVQLEAIGPNDVAYLLAGSPDTQSWELVMISRSGDEVRRTASATPDVEPYVDGLRERFCWSGCVPATRLLMAWDVSPSPYPSIAYTTGLVTVQYGLDWEIAWPYTPSARSQVALRWDGGAVLSLVPESGDAPSELIELLPNRSLQRFDLGDETVHALLRDGSAVVWRNGQLVGLTPPQPSQPPEWPTALAPDLTAQSFDPPIVCDRSPGYCPSVTLSPDGTFVVLDGSAQTLTWYDENGPRVVPLNAEPPLAVNEELYLIAIGPHDIAYIQSMNARPYIVAIAPSGTEITRASRSLGLNHAGLTDWRTYNGAVFPTATGLIGPWGTPDEWPPPGTELAMPWVDLDGNPIIDTRPYPTAKRAGAGMEVSLGEQRWLLTPEVLPAGSMRNLFLLPRSDGGVVMLNLPALELFELLPDGTIEHYDIFGISRVLLPSVLQRDGSFIGIHNLELLRLTPRD